LKSIVLPQAETTGSLPWSPLEAAQSIYNVRFLLKFFWEGIHKKEGYCHQCRIIRFIKNVCFEKILSAVQKFVMSQINLTVRIDTINSIVFNRIANVILIMIVITIIITEMKHLRDNKHSAVHMRMTGRVWPVWWLERHADASREQLLFKVTTT